MDQERYINIGACIAKEPQKVRESLPHGDALSVVIMSVWLVAPAIDVARTMKARWVIFVDDRSWTTTDATTCVQTAKKWADWSRRMGMKENEGKVQFWHKSGKGPKQLSEAGAKKEAMEEPFHALGTSMDGYKARKDSKKEVARVETAIATAHRIALLPAVTWVRLQVLAQTAIAKAAWGWTSRDLPATNTARIAKAVRLVAKDRGSGQGSPHLSAILRGHGTEVTFRIATATIQAARRRRAAGE